MKYSLLAIIISLLSFNVLGKEKLVFSCDFSNKYTPQVSVQSCLQSASNVKIVDVNNKKVLRVGKKIGSKAGRLSYFFPKKVKLASLPNHMHPFPMRYGKLNFRFRPVDWKLKDPGYNMLLRMEGPRGTLLHVVYICPKGVPSIQVAYGQQKNPAIGKGEIPVIYPFTKLDTTKEWHDIIVSWNPEEVNLTVDNNKVAMSTKNLAYPEKDFYAERIYLGYGLSSLSLGETDIANLKIWSVEPKAKSSSKQDRYPLLTVNTMPEPVIDGKVTAKEWNNVSKYSGFLKLPKLNQSEYQPIVQIGYDQKNLYFSIASFGHKRLPLTRETIRDSRVWKDDSIELYFATESKKDEFYHLVINHNGTIYDEHYQKNKNQATRVAWNCKNIKTATLVNGSTWNTEIAIPFESIGMKTPKAGDKILFNLCENIIGSGYYSLSSVKTRFSEYPKFGILKFGDKNSPVINFSKLGKLYLGDAAFNCSVSGKTPAQLAVSAKRYDQTADTEFALFSEIAQVNNKAKVCFKANAEKLKKNGIIYANLRQKGQIIYAGRFFYESTSTAEIENIRRQIVNNKNYLRVITTHMANPNNKLKLFVTNQNGKQLVEKIVPITGMKQTTNIDINNLLPGNYLLKGVILNKDGANLKALESREFTVYNKVVPWQDFAKKNIRQDHVPAPWTNLVVKQSKQNITVSLWNRVYTFSNKSLFAEQIKTSNINLLTKPVQLLLNLNNKVYPINKIEQTIVSKTPKKVVIKSVAKLFNNSNITVVANIDYDGFIWYQTTLNVPNNSSLDKLSILFSMDKKYSTLLNCGFRDLQNTGYTPNYWNKSLEGISGPFWVGMEKGGLSLGIESTENWSNKLVTNQAEVIKGKQGTNIVINIADMPIKIKPNTSYGFYLHPTPVRPRPQGFRELRTQDWFSHNRAAANSKTYYPTNFSWWTTTWYYQGHPDWAVNYSEIKKVSQRLPKEYARNGKFFNFDNLDRSKTRTAWYATYSSVGRNAPEVIWNGEQWYAGARERLYGNTFYGYNMDMIEVCKLSDYCDFFLWKFDQAKKAKPVIDGLYFDLWGPSACDRKDHNHGYTDNKGIRKSTYPVREHRKWLELVYLYCKEKANNAPIVCHVSGATAHIAGYSFADYLLDGELWFDKLAQDRSYKSMTLDMARSEILPHIWGPGVIWLSELHRAKGYVPADQQKTWSLSPWAMRHFSGLLLLHDVLPDRTSLFETARKIYLALDKFNLKDSDIYLPYWEICGISGSNDGKNTAITGYLKKDKSKLLLVVFNNFDYQLNAKVNLDVKKIFGKNRKVNVTDLETGKKLFNNVDNFTIPVSQRNFRLLEVAF